MRKNLSGFLFIVALLMLFTMLLTFAEGVAHGQEVDPAGLPVEPEPTRPADPRSTGNEIYMPLLLRPPGLGPDQILITLVDQTVDRVLPVTIFVFRDGQIERTNTRTKGSDNRMWSFPVTKGPFYVIRWVGQEDDVCTYYVISGFEQKDHLSIYPGRCG